MAPGALDSFGELLIRDVRDNAIRFSLQDDLVTAIANRSSTSDIETTVKVAVDKTIHYMLWLIERGLVQAVMVHDGEEVDIAASSDGLSGEIYTPDGWIARFSAFGPRPGD